MSEDVPLAVLFGVLVFLLLLSAFFSSTETALMTFNRYRLRHQARAGHRGARLVEHLLRRPDRIIGLILLGNNLVNIFAASLTTVIALRIGHEHAVAAGALILTVVVLIFAEVTPKTLAALRPEPLAKFAAFLYFPLLKIAYPIVWVLNMISNGLLRLIGISADDVGTHTLTKEELRTVVVEASAMIPGRRRKMLVSILDLEKVTVDDIMVPHNEIIGLNLADDWDEITTQIKNSQHTRLPLYQDTIDNMLGIVHVRDVVKALSAGELTKETLKALAREPYYVPEGTPLNKQLVNFQLAKKRIALVVDEYGDLQGLVTLDDILEEIVGNFTSDPADLHKDVYPEANGTYIVNCSANVRVLNRTMNWELPTDGAKTLNGLILEQLETIPEPGTTLKLNKYPIEILQTGESAVKTVRVHAPEQ